MGMMIAHAREQEGLYFLETSSCNGDRLPLPHLSTTSSLNKDQFWPHISV